jgi:hypothetical protein
MKCFLLAGILATALGCGSAADDEYKVEGPKADAVPGITQVGSDGRTVGEGEAPPVGAEAGKGAPGTMPGRGTR